MSKYQSFIFDSYNFDVRNKTLSLVYGYDDSLQFTETFKFDFDFIDYNPAVLDRACQLLFFMAGVSYYKAYLPPTIVVKTGDIDTRLASFLSKTYQRGLGEFFYVNNLDPAMTVEFPVTTEEPPRPLAHAGSGSMIGIGGGKDSLVSVELLRNITTATTWCVSHKAQLTPLINTIGLPHQWVERQWDRQLIDINNQDGLNGHVPISAILACVGTAAAVLSGKRDIVVSNEQSANEPTLQYQGQAINHQYSKSSEFEQDFQAILQHHFGDSLRYYSLLRPYSELRISELFAQYAYDKYKAVFSSCNRAFTHDSHKLFWCGTCPKCAFVFLALTPFLPRLQLEQIWDKNLLLDPALEQTYRELLGISGDKPLECVGEVKECRAAMKMAFETYPELAAKYIFELPADYDFRQTFSHDIPSDIAQIIAL